MKRRIFLMILAFVLFFPLGVVLTACGGNDGNTTNKVVAIYVENGDGEPYSSIYEVYEYEKTVEEGLGNLKFYFHYSNGENIEITAADDLQELLDSQRNYAFFPPENWEGGEYEFTDYEGEIDGDTILDVGHYKVVLTYHEIQPLVIEFSVEKVTVYNRTLKVSIVANEETQPGTTNSSTYAYSDMANTREWTSNVKAYVVEGNEIVSGTKSTSIYAMEKVVSEDYNISDDWQEKGVTAGTNLLDYYNNISVLNPETGDKDEYLTQQEQEYFLSSFGRELTLGRRQAQNYNGENKTLYGDSTDAYVVNTSALFPGEYLLFASYQDEQHVGILSTPFSSLTVTKGVFNLEKSLRFSDEHGEYYNDETTENGPFGNPDATYADFIHDIVSSIDDRVLSASYWFNTTNPVYSTNQQKAVTMSMFNVNEPNYENMNLYEYGIYGGGDGLRLYSNVCGDGRGIFGWGSFVLKANQANVDSRDNGISYKATFVLDHTIEELDRCYLDDPTEYYITLNIQKAVVDKPTTSYSEYDTYYEFDNTEKTLQVTISDDTAAVVNFAGTLSATNIGDYTATYTLKDTYNYEFYDYGDSTTDPVAFNWSIRKVLFTRYLFTPTLTYNSQTLEENVMEVDYVSGQKAIRLHLNNEKYNTIKQIAGSGIAMEWSLETEGYESTKYAPAGFEISQDGDDLLITFDEIQTNSEYFNLHLTIAETDYTNNFSTIESGNCFQITITKAEFTAEQLEDIYTNLGVTPVYEEGQITGYNWTNTDRETINISLVDMVIPTGTNPAALTGIGQWQLYYDGTPYADGAAAPSDWHATGWSWVFVLEDEMYQNVAPIVVEASYYKEDLDQAIVNALQTEIDGHTTLTLTDNGDYIGLSYGSIIEHNPEVGPIEGEWKLRFDYNDSYIDMTNNTQFSDISREVFEDTAARNYRLVFVLETDAYKYNEVEVSANVSFVA